MTLKTVRKEIQLDAFFYRAFLYSCQKTGDLCRSCLLISVKNSPNASPPNADSFCKNSSHKSVLQTCGHLYYVSLGYYEHL